MDQIKKDISLLCFILFLAALSFFTEGVFKAMVYGGIVGSIIGWSTNWAVIQMLFRPRNPLKIFRYKWSGLLIKKKPELARKIGEVVEQELLTKEKILERIDTAKPLIYEKIDAKVKELSKTQFGTVKEVAGNRFFPVIEDGRKRMVKDTSPFIEKSLFSQKTIKWISKEVINILRYYVNTPMIYVIGTERIDSAIETALKFLKEMDADKREEITLKLAEYFYEQISIHRKDIDRRLKDAVIKADADFLEDISNEIIAFANEWIGKEENKNLIKNNIAPLLDKISDSFEESGGFITWFINIKQKINETVDDHWNMIIETILLKLQHKDTSLFISSKLKEMFPTIINKIDISKTISSDTFKELYEQAFIFTGSKLINMIESESLVKKLRVKAYIMLEKPFRDLVPDWEKRVENILLKAADQYLDTLSTRKSSPVKEVLDRISQKALTNYKIGQVGERLSDSNKKALVNGATDIVFKWIKDNMPEIVDNNMCIGKMVESEISNFSNEELEKTVKAVADEELGTIIRLGGYLGVVAGSLSQLVIFIMG